MPKTMICAFTIVLATLIGPNAIAKTINFIYVGGECSTQWLSSSSAQYWNNGVFTFVAPDSNTYPAYQLVTGINDNVVNLDARIDNTGDIWSSVGQLATYLDTNCNNANVPGSVYTAYRTVNTTCKTYKCFPKLGCGCIAWNTTQQPYVVDNTHTCVIFDYSGGDIVVRNMLSMYEDRWNILAAYAIAGAGGGTEIASAYNADPSVDVSMLSDAPHASGEADYRAPGCAFQNWMDVDSVRSAYGAGYWAYDDTNGRPIYHVANVPVSVSRQPDLWSPTLPGTDDGVVAYHSSLGRADVGEFYTYRDSGPNGNYVGHYLLEAIDTHWITDYGTHWYMKLLGLAGVAGLGDICNFVSCAPDSGYYGSNPSLFSFGGSSMDCTYVSSLPAGASCL